MVVMWRSCLCLNLFFAYLYIYIYVCNYIVCLLDLLDSALLFGLAERSRTSRRSPLRRRGMTGSAQVQMAAQVQLAKLEKVKDVKVVKLVKLGEAKVHRVDQDRLTKPRALALQQELLNTFTAPKFQKKLNEIARKHSKSEERNSAYTSFRQLVRRSQREIIPRYGFDASEEGVECMMKAFRQLKDDPDIYVNECAIKEALSLDYGQFRSQSHDSEMSTQMSPMRQTLSELSELSETALLPRSAVQSGSIRNLVILWLRRLIIRFSTPTFQAYRSLKGFRLNDFTGPKGLPLDPKTSKTLKEQLAKVEVEVSESAAGDCEDLSAVHPPGAHDIGDIDGYCRLLAWADGKSEGVGQVRMMIKEVCILDEEVAQLFNTMNMTLGLQRCCNVTVLDF